MRGYRLGVDIGGTFTDGVLIDEQSGTIAIDKVLTTRDDPSSGFLQVVERLVARGARVPEHLRYVVHATTVATNAILERSGAQAGLLVTSGFRDILEIARQVRHELYNLQTDKPPALIPRRLCLEIPERMDYRGVVLVPMDEAAVIRAIDALRMQKVGSIAVCLLHAYANPAHEQRIGELIRDHYPEATVSLSSTIAPEIREYWRASTTAVNAYIAPIVRSYLDAIEHKLERGGFGTRIHMMQSNGGIMSTGAAKSRPVSIIESGPASGVTAAAYFASRFGFPHAISFDMGGTTAKAGLVLNGQPTVLPEFEVGSGAGSGAGVAKGSGYPILASVIDLVEIGAGGGSLAWIDSGGLMRVGPRSAGAEPGPACYGRGGDRPTVTDANLVLGRLNPDYFLGGQLQLNRDAAWTAIEAHCARPLGVDVIHAAMGIVDIANAAMMQAMRLISVQRGYDPREFAMVAFGGAGPVHANWLAHELRIPRIIIPPSPGVASALGMLVSDLRYDYHVTHIEPLDGASLDALHAIFDDFEARAVADLSTEQVAREAIHFERYLDMRYVGQSWKIPVVLPDSRLGAGSAAALRAAFDTLHAQRYGYSVSDEPVEIVNVRLTAVGAIPKPRLREFPHGGSDARTAQKSERKIYFAERGGFVVCPVYDRYALAVGNVITGPAIVEEMDSSTVIHPDYSADVLEHGVLVLHANRAEAGQSSAPDSL